MSLYSQNKVAFCCSIDGSLLVTKLSSKFIIVEELSNNTVVMLPSLFLGTTWAKLK